MLTKEEFRDPGSNWGPSDLQSDALPTEPSRLRYFRERCLCGGCGLVGGIEKQDATHHDQRRRGCGERGWGNGRMGRTVGQWEVFTA